MCTQLILAELVKTDCYYYIDTNEPFSWHRHLETPFIVESPAKVCSHRTSGPRQGHACPPAFGKVGKIYLFFDQVGIRWVSCVAQAGPGMAQVWPRRLLMFHCRNAMPRQTGIACYKDALPARYAKFFPSFA